jgi:glycosyltransferase involved in cell wall biosynthesis
MAVGWCAPSQRRDRRSSAQFDPLGLTLGGVKTMRVLRVIDCLDPRVGGPAVASLNSAISASRAGIRCDIAVVVRPGETETPWWGATMERCRDEGIALSGFPVFAPRLSPRHYDPSVEFVRWLLRRGRPRYDIVHAESPWTGACALASAIVAVGATRLVITPNAVFMPFDLSRGGIGIRMAKRAGVRMYGRAVDLIVCSSPLEMRDAQSVGLPTEKLTWIYHPVVDERVSIALPQPPARGPSGLRVGYLGRLHSEKNVAILIDAVGRLDSRVSLVIAGRGDATLEQELRRQAERVLPGRAEFIGWVSGDDKIRFLTGVDVLAMPSEYECFGVAAIEALAAGTPVIVGDHVGIADIVRTEHAGQVVPADVKSIAEALRKYLDDPEARHADATRATAAAVANASFAAHGARLANEYARILTTRSPD